ncbi:MAG: hypothetical protein R2748_19690 [Bryobacterales bacterium]
MLIETDAINTPSEILLVANLRDVDQRGNFVAEPGHFVGVVGDPRRDQFYVLGRRTPVRSYDGDMRVIRNLPDRQYADWMLDRGGNFLVVANSRGENLSIIDLNQMALRGSSSSRGKCCRRIYPTSLAASNRSIVIGGQGVGGVWKLTSHASGVSTPEAFGSTRMSSPPRSP